MTDTIMYEAHPPMFRNNPLLFSLCVVLIPVGVGLIALLGWYISSRARKLTLTSEELRYEEGILSKNRVEVRLSSIRSLRVNQTFFQRIFDTGDIEVFSSGDAPEITIKGVPHPARIRELVK